MIKQGVVTDNFTRCHVTGKTCTCEQPNGECVLMLNKTAALKEIGATLTEESKDKQND